MEWVVYLPFTILTYNLERNGSSGRVMKGGWDQLHTRACATRSETWSRNWRRRHRLGTGERQSRIVSGDILHSGCKKYFHGMGFVEYLISIDEESSNVAEECMSPEYVTRALRIL